MPGYLLYELFLNRSVSRSVVAIVILLHFRVVGLLCADVIEMRIYRKLIVRNLAWYIREAFSANSCVLRAEVELPRVLRSYIDPSLLGASVVTQVHHH